MPTTLYVKVKPNARAEQLSQQADGTWLAHIKALPVDGAANAALLALVAKHFDVAKSKVRLISGSTSRLKCVEINN